MKETILFDNVKLHNCSVNESFDFIDASMEERRFLAIEEVSLRALTLATAEPRVAEALGLLNHTIIADAEILNLLKCNDVARKLEVEDHAFFKEVMTRIERDGRRIFLLGETKAAIAKLVKYLLANYPNVAIAGTGALEDCVGADEALVNTINSLSPNVIVSLLPSPRQEMFLYEHRKKLFANFWYGMGEIRPTGEKAKLRERLRKHKMRRDLEKVIKEQEKKQEKKRHE